MLLGKLVYKSPSSRAAPAEAVARYERNGPALLVGWPQKPTVYKKNEEGHTLPRFALRVLQLLEKLEFRFRHLAIQRREASGIDARPCEPARCDIVFRIEAHRHAATRRYRARGRNHGRMRMRGSKGGLRCHSRMRRLKRHNVGM